MLSGRSDTVVLLTEADTVSVGQVRDGLPHIESDLCGSLVSGCPSLNPHSPSVADTIATTVTLLAEQNRPAPALSSRSRLVAANSPTSWCRKPQRPDGRELRW